MVLENKLTEIFYPFTEICLWEEKNWNEKIKENSRKMENTLETWREVFWFNFFPYFFLILLGGIYLWIFVLCGLLEWGLG